LVSLLTENDNVVRRGHDDGWINPEKVEIVYTEISARRAGARSGYRWFTGSRSASSLLLERARLSRMSGSASLIAKWTRMSRMLWSLNAGSCACMRTPRALSKPARFMSPVPLRSPLALRPRTMAGL
jgi:hypothetical protein